MTQIKSNLLYLTFLEKIVKNIFDFNLPTHKLAPSKLGLHWQRIFVTWGSHFRQTGGGVVSPPKVCLCRLLITAPNPNVSNRNAISVTSS